MDENKKLTERCSTAGCKGDGTPMMTVTEKVNHLPSLGGRARMPTMTAIEKIGSHCWMGMPMTMVTEEVNHPISGWESENNQSQLALLFVYSVFCFCFKLLVLVSPRHKPKEG